MARRRWLPDHVTEYKDRHGKARFRFRKKGLPEHHFKHAPGTRAFMEELLLAQAGGHSVKADRFAPGTFDDLATRYYTSPRFLALKPITQATYRGIIDRFRVRYGHLPVARMSAGHIETIMSKMAATPGAANSLRKMLGILLRYSVKIGMRQDNPVPATDKFKRTGTGFHCWTEDEIVQFEKHWKLGTRERLAMALLLNTALRRSDVVRIGRQNLVGNTIVLWHEKNRSETVLPISADLRRALDAIPIDGRMLFLQTEFGKGFTAAGFGNWFKDKCMDAGLPHCTAHGLRKAMARRLAETGATSMQGRAVTGQRTARIFEEYAETANRTQMAKTAMANLEKRFAKKPPKK